MREWGHGRHSFSRYQTYQLKRACLAVWSQNNGDMLGTAVMSADIADLNRYFKDAGDFYDT